MKIMENYSKHFLRTVEKFYVKLYRHQHGTLENSKSKKRKNTVLQDATHSWQSLGPEDKQIFIDQYKKWGSNRNAKIADYLQRASKTQIKRLVESMKTNISAFDMIMDDESLSTNVTDIQNNVSEMPQIGVLEICVNNIPEKVSQPVLRVENKTIRETTNITVTQTNEPEVPQNSVLRICQNNAPDKVPQPATRMEDKIISETTNVPDITQTNEPEVEISQTSAPPVFTPKLPKPNPPVVLNSQQFYELLHRNSEDRRPFCSLTALDKKRYSRALLKLKRDYLQKYESYLHSLPSEELYYHMMDVLNTSFNNSTN